MKNIIKTKNSKLISLILFFFSTLALEDCRHAWVRFPQNPPAACLVFQQSNECKRALEAQKVKQAEPGKIHVIPQKYYLFGLLPKEQIVDVSKYCPEGPRSAHQFTSFWDAVWEQLTLTVYSPQTLEVECYP